MNDRDQLKKKDCGKRMDFKYTFSSSIHYLIQKYCDIFLMIYPKISGKDTKKQIATKNKIATDRRCQFEARVMKSRESIQHNIIVAELQNLLFLLQGIKSKGTLSEICHNDFSYIYIKIRTYIQNTSIFQAVPYFLNCILMQAVIR